MKTGKFEERKGYSTIDGKYIGVVNGREKLFNSEDEYNAHMNDQDMMALYIKEPQEVIDELEAENYID